MRHKKVRTGELLELNMTAMCDVVFNLLIYLVLTATPAVVFSVLDISRPTPPPDVIEKPPPLTEIMVMSDAYVVNGRRVSSQGLANFLEEVSKYSKTQNIFVKCAWDSPHENLVRCLDYCNKNGLMEISVLSM
jgi:biopolymer transport protein ExbD